MNALLKRVALLGILIVISIYFDSLQKNVYPFQMTFLDVGQGDATYISFPDGTDMLIDCGRNRSVLHELGSVMGILDRSIDVLVITHPDSDHYAGCIDVLERFDVGSVVLPDYDKDTFLDKEVHDSILQEEQKGAQQIHPRANTFWQFGSSTVHILSAHAKKDGVSSNNASIVMQISYASTTILLTGDAEEELEAELVEAYNLKSDVLKIGHHGSKTSSILPFLQEVNPRYGIISSGLDNSYGHPHFDVLDRLARGNIEVFRTDTGGRISLYVNEDGFIIFDEYGNEKRE